MRGSGSESDREVRAQRKQKTGLPGTIMDRCKVSPALNAYAWLDVEVLHVQRILFDELAPGFHILTHQRGEDRFRLRQVFELH